MDWHSASSISEFFRLYSEKFRGSKNRLESFLDPLGVMGKRKVIKGKTQKYIKYKIDMRMGNTLKKLSS